MYVWCFAPHSTDMILGVLVVGVARAQLSNVEEALLAVPDAQILRSHLYNLTLQSHVMGTPGDWANAKYMQSALESLGVFDEVVIEGVPVMRQLPVAQPSLVAVQDGETWFTAQLSEDVVAGDAMSQSSWRNHTYNAYSPSGVATARLVYANYGMPSDFDALEKVGVNVSGAVVLTRYGGCFRGLKAMNSEARGAAATIIYSDPIDDGFVQGAVYPEGPWRPPSAVQRGSAQYLSICAGDPYRLYLNGSEHPCGNYSYVPTKPVLPLSYGDAKPLLERLGGPVAPDVFQGGLPFTYTVGPSTYEVRLETNHSYESVTIPNVLATVRGAEEPGRTVLAGNHRDAWVAGAVDPHSGTVALLEVARGLATLKRDFDWRPRRTVTLCSWSGEEFGLLGSTAFTELHAQSLDTSAVAYINVDVGVAGNNSKLTAAGTQSLDYLFARALGDAHLDDLWVAAEESDGAKAALPNVTKLGTLGSGSDYTSFLDNLGIPSLDMTFRGDYGVYHSVYDSFHWVDTVGDPDYQRHVFVTQVFALLVYRLADFDVLPVRLSTQSRAIDAYIDELDDGQVDVAPLRTAAESFERAATCVDAKADFALLDHGTTDVAAINDHLVFSERRFLTEAGLPDRPYYKHILQAPGYYLGYGSTAFPGVVHALENDDAAAAADQVQIAASCIHKVAAYVAEVCPEAIVDA